jgi:membrane protein DedA with SNARE-associated domain
MESLFLHYFISLGLWIYALIFIGMIIEGETFLFASIYLAHLDYLNLNILITVVFAGIVFSDFFWYFIGGHLEKKSQFARKWMGKVSGVLDKRMQRNPVSTLFIMRFTLIYHGVLMRAGALGVPLISYLKTIIVSSIAWVSLIGGIAYFSSAYLDLFKKYLKYGETALLIGIIIFLFISHFISKYARKGIENNNVS